MEPIMENNIVKLDGMEKIEADNRAVYLPSKSRLTTQKEIERDNRPAMTRNWFNRINPDIVDLDAGWPSASIREAHIGNMDINSMYDHVNVMYDPGGSMSATNTAFTSNLFFDEADIEKMKAAIDAMVEDIKKWESKPAFLSTPKFSEAMAAELSDAKIKFLEDDLKPFLYVDSIRPSPMDCDVSKPRKQEMDTGFYYCPYIPQDLRPKMDVNTWGEVYPIESLPETISTGNQALDTLLGGGLKPGTVTLFASKAGVGKSALARNVAAGLSINGTEFLWLTAEDSTENIVERIQTLNNHNTDTGYKVLRMHDWSLNGLVNTIREQVEDDVNARVVFVDGLDFYKDAGSHALGTQLRRLAQDLDVAIIGTNQLHSRFSDDDVAKMPASDIGLTTAVDTIVALTRKDHEVELVCLKNRMTGNYNHKVLFDPARNLIWEPLIKPVLPIKSQLMPFANLKAAFATSIEPDYPVADWL